MSRGLSTAIVEARDWASGTSSRSSKLIHGGLRYLEMLDFGLVHEALRERGLLLDRIAPHLVRPVPFLYPLQHRVWERAYAGTGIALYDVLGLCLRQRPRAQAPSPPVPQARAAGGAVPAPGCAHRGNPVLGRAGGRRQVHADPGPHRRPVRRARGEQDPGERLPPGGERVTGASVTDLETGRAFEVRAKQVINATGVWTDDTQAMADTRGQFHVRASKGSTSSCLATG